MLLYGRAHAQQGLRTLGLRSSEPGGVPEGSVSRIYPFGQCRCRGIWHMDAVHHSLQFACTESLGCTSSCRRVQKVPKGQKATWVAKGAKTLTAMGKESDRQLPFLDILLSREEDGFISTSVHRKNHPHESVSVLSFSPPCNPQTSCCEDTDVQSGGPLSIGSESCSGREACVAGPPGKWLLRGVHTQAHLPTA